MTASVKHTFQVAIPDDPADALAGKVLPSHWLAEHDLSGLVTSVNEQTGDVVIPSHVFVQASDPDTQADPGDLWVDTTTPGPPWHVQIRNATDDGWEDLLADYDVGFSGLHLTAESEVVLLSRSQPIYITAGTTGLETGARLTVLPSGGTAELRGGGSETVGASAAIRGGPTDGNVGARFLAKGGEEGVADGKAQVTTNGSTGPGFLYSDGTDLEYVASVSPFDGKPFIWTPATVPATEDDEFGDATGQSGPINGLDAKWTKHGLGTAGWTILDDAQAPGCVLFKVPSGENGDQSIYQAVPAGDFQITVRFATQISGRQMWGPFIVDSSGDGICSLFDGGVNNPQTGGLRTLTAWEDGGDFTAFDLNSSQVQSLGLPVTLTLRQDGGDYYAGWFLGERLLGAAVLEKVKTPAAFTPAFIGFGRFYSESGASLVALDAFRVLA